jgi:hypothetical protein
MPLQEIVANISGGIRKATLQGVEYIVAPVAMLTPGVHEGSQGPLYYPEEEVAKLPAVWNHKPISIFHPKDASGKPISACSIESLEKDNVGVILNSDYKDSKLRAEAWLNEVRLKAISPAVYNSVLKGEVVEVSTGLFTENTNTEGEWNGEKYVAIARNYKPDHLAILPGLKGACSVADGAGLGVTNEAAKAREIVREFVLNEQSHDQIRTTLQSEVRRVYGDAWVMDVYSDNLIYELGNRTYRLSYSVSGETVTLGTDPVKVDRVVEYRPAPTANETGAQDGDDMDKAKIVSGLIANAKTGYVEADRAGLMQLPETTLKTLAANADKAAKEPEPKPDGEGKKVEKGAEKTGEEGEGGNNPAVTAPGTGAAKGAEPTGNAQGGQFVQIPKDKWDSIERMVSNARRIEDRERHHLISTITANAAGIYTEDELKGMELPALEKLARMATANAQAADPTASLFDYSGAGFPSFSANEGGESDRPAPMAVLNTMPPKK